MLPKHKRLKQKRGGHLFANLLCNFRLLTFVWLLFFAAAAKCQNRGDQETLRQQVNLSEAKDESKLDASGSNRVEQIYFGDPTSSWPPPQQIQQATNVQQQLFRGRLFLPSPSTRFQAPKIIDQLKRTTSK